VIFVSVGTFIKGFDELIVAMDDACKQTGLPAFAQIGNSAVVPKNMQFARFLSAADMQHHLNAAALVVCHGGFGIIGDAMRAQKPIIAVPRQNTVNSTDAPANNQLVVVRRLCDIYGIQACTEMHELPALILDVTRKMNGSKRYDLLCDIPEVINDFLAKA